MYRGQRERERERESTVSEFLIKNTSSKPKSSVRRLTEWPREQDYARENFPPNFLLYKMKLVAFKFYKDGNNWTVVEWENLGGRVMRGSSPISFCIAIPIAYPKARATGTATAFPT